MKHLHCLTLVFLCVISTNAQISFDFENIQSGALVDGVRTLEIGDLDGDGDLDFVSASTSPTNVVNLVWYENNGSGSFTHHLISTSPNVAGMRDLKLIDMDGDFDTDILGSSGSRILLVRNNGDGTFTPLTIYNDPKVGTIFGIDAGDLDFDGDPDIVVPGRGTGSIDGAVFWLKNDGSGAFTEMPSVWNTNTAFNVMIYDFDSDNDNDILATRSGSNNSVRVFINDGTGVFTNFIIDPDSGARYLTVGDTNNDGNQEILVSFRDRDQIRKYIYDRFDDTWTTQIVTSPNAPDFVRVQDVNQDGFGDILLTSITDGVFYWLESDGSGTSFNNRVIDNSSSTASGAIDMVSLDVDGDTDIDIIGAASTSDVITLYKNPTIVLSNSEYEFDRLFTIYPNPASEFLHIKNPNNLNLTHVMLLDNNGRIVRKNIDPSQPLQLNGLSRGVYFLSMISEKKKFVKKVVLGN